MKKVVEYDSKMNDLSFGKFKEKELDLFFSICYRMKNEGVNEVTLTFQELKELSNYSNRNLDRFVKDLQNVYKKLLNITMEFETEKEIIGFVLFTDYRVTKEERTVSIRVNDRYSYILNDIVKFTKFDLIEFSNLKSSYARNVFRLLKQFDGNKENWYQIKLDKFKVMLDIPNSYKMSHIDSFVLSPILQQLAPYFNGLKLEKIKRGVKVDSLKFTWKEKKKQIKESPAIKKKQVLGEKDLEEHNEQFKQFENFEEQKSTIDRVEKVEKIKISRTDYEELYEKYLEENKETHNPFIRKGFDIAKNKYEIMEFQQPNQEQKKIYKIEDITEDKLLDKNGNKLKGMLLNNRINKILKEMNENGSI